MDPIWKTFEELTPDPVGTIYVDEPVADGKGRFVILRGPSSLCGYIMVEPAELDATKSTILSNLLVHGGVTMDSVIDAKKTSPAFARFDGFHAFGWDYAHAYDRTTFADVRVRKIFATMPRPEGLVEKAWDVRMVYEDSFDAVKLAEECLSPPVLVGATPITVVKKPFGEFTVRRVFGKKKEAQ